MTSLAMLPSEQTQERSHKLKTPNKPKCAGSVLACACFDLLLSTGVAPRVASLPFRMTFGTLLNLPLDTDKTEVGFQVAHKEHTGQIL